VSPRSSSAAAGGVSRRTRTVTESLLSIVLVIEAIVLFFAGLVAFGLKVLEPALPAWVALPAAGVAIVVLLVATQLLRFRWGVWLGWVLQAGLIALGILVPTMYVVGVGFTLFWIYCFIRGRRIDAAKSSQGDPA
jgi:hypothetical protein